MLRVGIVTIQISAYDKCLNIADQCSNVLPETSWVLLELKVARAFAMPVSIVIPYLMMACTKRIGRVVPVSVCNSFSDICRRIRTLGVLDTP